jgi:hypothetical protein
MASGGLESRRREVLRVLRASPDPMSIVAIADDLDVDVHPNTVGFLENGERVDAGVLQLDRHA